VVPGVVGKYDRGVVEAHVNEEVQVGFRQALGFLFRILFRQV
jgi:hypothetical protein